MNMTKNNEKITGIDSVLQCDDILFIILSGSLKRITRDIILEVENCEYQFDVRSPKW